MNINRKTAFSMPELLIVFVIMSVLMIISLYTVNNRYTDFFTRYYSAYDALSKAAYNTYTDTYCRTKAGTGNTDCIVGGSNFESTGRPFPTTQTELCKRLGEYLNVTPGSTCKEATIPIPGINSNSEINDSKFNDSTLQFKTTNGFKFYFSKYRTTLLPHGNGRNSTGYFIVFVDLNGDSRPNTYGLPHPDIVPFIVTVKGDVIPVGYPVFDKTYATARIIDSNGNQTKSFTIDEARQIAFGNNDFILNRKDNKPNCMYNDIPITEIKHFHSIIPGLIPIGTPTPAHHALGDSDGDGSNDLECLQGTFNCMFKIDENLERRH